MGPFRCRKALLLSTALAGAMLFAANHAALAQGTPVYQFDIPAESLGQSLKDFSAASSQQIVFSDDVIGSRSAPALHGSYTSDQALALLLDGTGLHVEVSKSGVLMVKPKNVEAASDEAAANGTETVVVTGSRIRGAKSASPVISLYSRQDLDRSGAGSLDQFARQMPENLSNTDGIANVFSSAQLAAHPGGDPNNNAGAAFNIGGLGIDATLTLLDGHRMAASGNVGAFVDVSMIPFSAIDHIEVLTDGASSIYGSDAVGGVVNLIMKKDFNGAESSVRYGGATDGGADEITASQLFGKSWSGGNALVNVEYDGQNGLDARQRDYIPNQGGPSTLLPKSHRLSVFLDGNEEIDDATTITAEGLYSHKNIYLDATTKSFVEDVSTTQPGGVSQATGTLSLDHKLSDDWQVDLTANYATVDQYFDQSAVITLPSVPGFKEIFVGHTPTAADTLGFDAVANGTLWSLPAGDIKTAFGASYRSESFHTGTVATVNGAVTKYVYPRYSRNVESVFDEVFVPLVGEANALPFVRRLDLSGAVRFDDYSDFGSTTNPKVGIDWMPIDELNLRATWGTSYRAPLLSDLDVPLSYNAEYLPNPAAPAHVTDTLLVSGGNPNLKPQTATVVSAGADWQPVWVPGLKVSLTYVYVHYKNLIGLPPVTNQGAIFSDPALAPFINTHPNLAYVASAFASPGFQGNSTGLGPSFVQAIFNEQDANLAAETESNFDMRASYALQSEIGAFVFTGTVDHFSSDTLQSAPAAPTIPILNTFGEPMRWKGRAGTTWSLDDFTAAVTVNYVNGYTDNLTIPAGRIASWTTADLYLGYSLGEANSTALDDVRLSLTVQNITDEKPPFVLFPPSAVLPGQVSKPIDTVNASPVGRLIAVQVTRDF